MNFNDTLQVHIEAMVNKDLDTFISTVSTDDITLIMPNGSLITDYDSFYNLHKDWFSDEDWSLNYTVIKQIESTEMSSVLLSVEYTDCDEKGEPIYMTYYLNLVFRLVDSKWKLVHDQNTIFKDKV